MNESHVQTSVSVICATRNGGAFITRAIESVLHQTIPPNEIIIVDDASTDTTPTVIQNLIVAHPQANIRLITNTNNVGPGKARTQAINASTSQYIALIDDDDWWISSDKLRAQISFLEAHRDHCLVGCTNTHLMNEDGAQIGIYTNPATDADIRAIILRKNCFTTSSVVFKKDTYLATGGFKPLYLAEDYDMWLRMGKIAKFSNIPEADTAYTVRTGSISKRREKDMYTSILSIVKDHKHEYPGAFIGITKAYVRLLYLRMKNFL
ncbi:MAG TPA: glycosyltransferase [Candidatus Paceibacterota bacterium]|nr:glycosyltransferase [Candidatus Paceibacterota bacterium]